MKRKGINFHIYPDGINHLLKYYVFVNLVETEEGGEKTNYDLCEQHIVRFYHTSTQ